MVLWSDILEYLDVEPCDLHWSLIDRLRLSLQFLDILWETDFGVGYSEDGGDIQMQQFDILFHPQ